MSAAVELYEKDQLREPAWRWLAIQGLASAIEKIYTGCERVMSMIASEVDRAKISKDEGRHMQLLKRMAHPFPGTRDPVISEETFRRLDRLRSFRHRERNSYGSALDADIVMQRARETMDAFSAFQSDVTDWSARQASGST